jgi:hypothetical protein
MLLKMEKYVNASLERFSQEAVRRFVKRRLNRVLELRKKALALAKSYGRLAPFHSPLT